MKVNFIPPSDGTYHQYCFECASESVSRTQKDEKTYYECTSCRVLSPRSIVIDPEINWWMDGNDYWHESSGVFVAHEGKFLFFERTIFPFSATIPAGHVDSGEEPAVAAVRELQEEVGIRARPADLVTIATSDLRKDSYRRGSDYHKWHAFAFKMNSDPGAISVEEEGFGPKWLTIDEALTKDLTYPVRFMLENHRSELKNI